MPDMTLQRFREWCLEQTAWSTDAGIELFEIAVDVARKAQENNDAEPESPE